MWMPYNILHVTDADAQLYHDGVPSGWYLRNRDYKLLGGAAAVPAQLTPEQQRLVAGLLIDPNFDAEGRLSYGNFYNTYCHPSSSVAYRLAYAKKLEILMPLFPHAFPAKVVYIPDKDCGKVGVFACAYNSLGVPLQPKLHRITYRDLGRIAAGGRGLASRFGVGLYAAQLADLTAN